MNDQPQVSLLKLCFTVSFCVLFAKVGAARHPLQLQPGTVQLQPGTVQLGALELKVLTNYFDNAQLRAHMHNFVERCKPISRIFSIGKSRQGEEILALELSNKAGVVEPEPYFLYVGNIHGDEPTGRQFLLALAEWLCASYPADPQAKRIIDDMHLVLVPTANPDGYTVMKRENSANVDLNRDFPDPVLHKGHDLHEPRPETQQETLALMTLATRMRFTGSSVLHEGALVANYPYDGYKDGSLAVSGEKHASPDDTTFVYLASVYANNHKTMFKSPEFQGGITNGAKWYPVYGGSQDWHYLAAGCWELTLELSQAKHPPANKLAPLYEENRGALIMLAITAALGGVRGTVRRAGTNTPLLATIAVVGIDHNITTVHLNGYYSRPLAPGKYEVLVTAEGYKPVKRAVEVPSDTKGVVADFFMEPANAGSQPVSGAGVKALNGSVAAGKSEAPGAALVANMTLPRASAGGVKPGNVSSAAGPAVPAPTPSPTNTTSTQAPVSGGTAAVVELKLPYGASTYHVAQAALLILLHVVAIGGFVWWWRGRASPQERAISPHSQ